MSKSTHTPIHKHCQHNLLWHPSYARINNRQSFWSMPQSSFEIFQRYTSSRIKGVKLQDTRPRSTHLRFILGMLFLKYNHRKPKKKWESVMKLKALKPSYKEIEATYGHGRKGPFQIEPIIWLLLKFLELHDHSASTSGFQDPRHFYKWAASTHIFSTKNGAFGYDNSQTCNIYKQWEASTTYMHVASATRTRGLMLIPIFATYFLQAWLNRARLHYGLNSCTILYYILFF